MPTPAPTVAKRPERLRAPRIKTLIAFSALIMLLFCVFVAYQASKAYEAAIIEAKQNASRLTNILADQVELTFLAVDLTLRRAVERQYFNTMFGGNLPHDIENNFKLWVDETPQIVAMMLVNDKGVVEVAANKNGYDAWMDYSASLGENPIFSSLKPDSEQGYFITAHRTGNNHFPELVLVSRRITNIDGSFGGAVIAAIEPRYFFDFFSSVDFGTERLMALMLDSGKLLYTGPQRDESDEAMLDVIGSKAAVSQDKHSITADTQNMNGEIKVYGYTQIKNLPIVTAVVMNEDDFLKNWRKGRIKDISFLAIFTIFGSVLSFFALTMARQIARVEESESAAILASQAKSEFLANMSHELRTPLNAIIGFSEMLGAGYFGSLTDKQKERVQDINLCGTHLLQLISDILEFSKGEAGKLELKEEPLILADTVQECTRMLAERARSKSVQLVAEPAPNLPLLMADKRKLRQILINLLSNAIKFTPSGGTVRVTAALDHHQLVITVTDTGIGIAEDDIPVALSVFGQVHRAHNHEGTGLGLPLCKMFAELHGGKLLLTSVVGEGTTVKIIFPANRVMET
jgi:signal transduction histidine kinase